MSERIVEAFVDKLILLEQNTGANVQYSIMPPFAAPFHDHLSIQETAKRIAESIGLTGYTFIVAVAKQKEKVAGHIDLSTEETDVFIEIDPEMMKFPDSVGATLCHEVSHKWLHRNRIGYTKEMDNEILTDITSVYLGFGKVMLNGCITHNVRYETIPNGTREIKQTMRAGYLDLDQFALAYNLVCAMRKIPSSHLMQGLNAEANYAVCVCNLTLGHYYADHFHRLGLSCESVNGLQSAVTQAQLTMADLDKHVTYTRRSFCGTISAFLGTGHKVLERLRQKAIASVGETSEDPALRFLRAIKAKCEIRRLSAQIQSISQEADRFLKPAKAFSRHLLRNSQRFPPPSPTMFSIVVCPKDGTKIRLPENSGDLIATCPVCRYRFAYNTNAVLF